MNWSSTVILFIGLIVILVGLVIVFWNMNNDIKEITKKCENIEELIFFAEMAKMAYFPENPNLINSFAKKNDLIFDSKKDIFTDKNTNTVVLFFKRNNIIYISFRGTIVTSLENIEEDIDIYKVPFYGTNVSRGFLKGWSGLRSEVLSRVAESNSVVITGHSLGAAISSIAAIDIFETTKIKPICVTFASPRVGDELFVELFKKLIGESTRVEGKFDPIPRLPTTYQGFKHIPTMYLISEDRCIIGGPPPKNWVWDIRYHYIDKYIDILKTLNQEEILPLK